MTQPPPPTRWQRVKGIAASVVIVSMAVGALACHMIKTSLRRQPRE